MISQSRYVNIISGVGAAADITAKSLTMRVMTQNVLLPPDTVLEFSGSDMASDVANYFGDTSEEYKRALAYSSFVSKQINSPGKISFGRWAAANMGPTVYGASGTKPLASLINVSNGSVFISVDGTVYQAINMDFTKQTTLAGVASVIQATVRALDNDQLKTATVTYYDQTGQFLLTGGVTGSGSIKVVSEGSEGVGNDVTKALGWGPGLETESTGMTAQTPSQALQASINVSNNFGSVVYPVLSNSQAVDIASYIDSQNNQYMLSLTCTSDNASTLSGLLAGYSGVAINLADYSVTDDYVDQCPCEILAATDYTQSDATQNYMFYQFPNRNITVNSDTDANTMDKLRLNYIGQTQVNGQQLAFYQRGILMGGSTAPVDMNTYANEMWRKSAIAASIMSFFLAVGRVPANDSGKGQILAVIQSDIDQAKTNGVISAGKTLSTTQQLYITTISGDKNAWRQVQSIGYWINVVVESYTDDNNGLTQYKAAYTLIYSKDDAIRKVTGQDILI